MTLRVEMRRYLRLAVGLPRYNSFRFVSVGCKLRGMSRIFCSLRSVKRESMGVVLALKLPAVPLISISLEWLP